MLNPDCDRGDARGAATKTGRPRPTLFRALGHADPPTEIVVDGRRYQRAEIFKHDSWAATAVYGTGAERIVCKFNRTQSVIIPMGWLGRWLARHEARVLSRMQGTPGIPKLCWPITDGARPLRNAVAHAFVPGRPLARRERPTSEFFGQLANLLGTLHEHDIAYVDLHKRENVLVGEDGQPYLIDFQISFILPQSWLRNVWPLRPVLRLLQQADFFHLKKHILRSNDHELSRSAEQIVLGPPWWVKLHRLVAVPFRKARRTLLVLLGIRHGKGRADSEFMPEIAIRRTPLSMAERDLHPSQGARRAA